jgi:single-strand DNA-binding protein
MKNRVFLLGNLGMDPEIKTFEGGQKKVRVSIATSEKYTNKAGEKVEDVQWHNLVGFGKVADIFEKFTKKGNQIAVEGKLTSRDYTDDKGIKRYITEVQINEVTLLGSPNK